ncbi:P1 family peptidase [Faecalibacterium sp. An122]|uniref:DmpA family aminopeptidase n=1 Tax=Faecalibacterium sp. An122 TaxID=1965551 RepID=UPI000B38183D|nr:P1 family peptidase [Faecalibacterium sp. An122]OUQ39093.1 aminopeptidase [Faecalibacterium sp. An122]
MGIESRWGFRVGSLPHGPLNKISDVPGVTVGHCTLSRGGVQTGVTALLPHPGDTFHEKVLAASHVINGFGKTIGLVQIDELGTLETPILFTNTLSVGTAATALVKYMLDRCPDICETTGSVNPVVCECNDSGLNDIRGLHVTEADALAALADCRADFAEGAVGAGRGMRCHGLKGGIGSSSRAVELDGQTYHMGALVLSNHAKFDDLIVAGVPVAQRLEQAAQVPPHEDKGSIITVLATDVPLSERQLGRIARRAIVGLSRTGSYCGNGSGEIVIAFSTGNRISHYPQSDLVPLRAAAENKMDLLFRAAAECVEESVLSSLLHAETVTGRNGLTVRSLADLLQGRPD